MTKDKDIAKITDDFKNEIRAELRSVKDCLKFCRDTGDETKAIGSDVKALRKEISDLIKLKERLSSENNHLVQRIKELQQYSRLNNLEIKGVNSDYAAAQVLKKIREAIHEPIWDSDIYTCLGMPTRKADKTNIIARFMRRDKRHAFLAKARNEKGSNESVGYSDQGLVYVNASHSGNQTTGRGHNCSKKRGSRGSSFGPAEAESSHARRKTQML